MRKVNRESERDRNTGIETGKDGEKERERKGKGN